MFAHAPKKILSCFACCKRKLLESLFLITAKGQLLLVINVLLCWYIIFFSLCRSRTLKFGFFEIVGILVLDMIGPGYGYEIFVGSFKFCHFYFFFSFPFSRSINLVPRARWLLYLDFWIDIGLSWSKLSLTKLFKLEINTWFKVLRIQIVVLSTSFMSVNFPQKWS